MQEKTVAAISTPKGEGGISIIRISGSEAIAIADRCFKSSCGRLLASLKGYEAAFGAVYDGDKKIDDAIALVFRAPKSYTGEDVVELSVHGGKAASELTLRAVLRSGATVAAGGEFTKRAFLNGKLDLAEAESVMELISAKNETALRISLAAKDGRISREIEATKQKLLETAANIAAYSDYPDEDLENLSFDNFSRLLKECSASLKTMLDNFDNSRALREGIDCAIVGKPNVGKSTLMNMLSGQERSIVTDIAGTTRDIIENTVQLGDILLNLADTAGLRQTDDIIENAGVKLSEKRIASSSLILAVFDCSQALDSDDLQLLSRLDNTRTLIVLNKNDLDRRIDSCSFEGFRCIEISAKENKGLTELRLAISELSGAAKIAENDPILISERQRSCAQSAYDSVCEALESLLGGYTLDAVGICVDDALSSLLELVGERVTNEVCDEIFRRFCVGK